MRFGTVSNDNPVLSYRQVPFAGHKYRSLRYLSTSLMVSLALTTLIPDPILDQLRKETLFNLLIYRGSTVTCTCHLQKKPTGGLQMHRKHQIVKALC